MALVRLIMPNNSGDITSVNAMGKTFVNCMTGDAFG
jgi:hypothetical protein